MKQPVRVILPAVWIIGAIAAFFYSQQKHVPGAIAIPVAAAFLAEISLYSMIGHRIWKSPLLLWASAPVSYLIYSLGTGRFSPQSLLLLLALTGIASFWLERTKPHPLTDLLFLLLMAAVYIGRVLNDIYPEPFPSVTTSALGKVMAFRLTITAIVHYRGHPDLGFGFFPSRKEWLIGLRWFLYFLPVAAVVAYSIGFGSLRLLNGFWWKLPLYFLGWLWVVALGEEVFFRGFVLHRLRHNLGKNGALILSSLIYGIAHLWFGQFPNVNHVIMTTTAGLFFGWAYLEAKTIRAPVVTHALVVATWRAFIA